MVTRRERAALVSLVYNTGIAQRAAQIVLCGLHQLHIDSPRSRLVFAIAEAECYRQPDCKPILIKQAIFNVQENVAPFAIGTYKSKSPFRKPFANQACVVPVYSLAGSCSSTPVLGRTFTSWNVPRLIARVASADRCLMRLDLGRPTPKEEIEDVAACTRGFGNMPLVVLSEKWVYSPNADGQEKEEARREAERQARLAALSTRGKKIDLDSGHLIPLESPSAVVDAVRHVVLTAQSVQ